MFLIWSVEDLFKLFCVYRAKGIKCNIAQSSAWSKLRSTEEGLA